MGEASDWRRGERLGQGGQGTTYAATREGDTNEYVIKVLDDTHDAKALARFQVEVLTAQSLAASGCPGIVGVVDAYLNPSGGTAPWFVMQRHAPVWSGGRYAEGYAGNVDRVLEIAEQMAATLEFIHAAGYVHRDIKPGNVFLDKDGHPLLGDFGLAYEPGREPSVTTTPERLGNYWRPPELLSGSQVQRNSGSDMYMLGGFIYELLSNGQTFGLAEQGGQYTHERPEYNLERRYSDPRVVYINQMLRGMFRADPNQRYSATAVRDLCRRIREYRPGAPPPVLTSGIDEAASAAAEYMARSTRIRDARTRGELGAVCERVAKQVQDRAASRSEYVQVSIQPNFGDVAAFERAGRGHLGVVWAAVRVMVDFEPTSGERQYLLAYTFIGRTPTGEEFIAALNSGGEWRELAHGPAGTPQHEEAMIASIVEQVESTAQHMASVIRGLERDSRA